MHPSKSQTSGARTQEELTPGRIDWPSWAMLAWMLGVLTLYTKMVLEARFPGVLAVLQRWLGQGFG